MAICPLNPRAEAVMDAPYQTVNGLDAETAAPCRPDAGYGLLPAFDGVHVPHANRVQTMRLRYAGPLAVPLRSAAASGLHIQARCFQPLEQCPAGAVHRRRVAQGSTSRIVNGTMRWTRARPRSSSRHARFSEHGISGLVSLQHPYGHCCLLYPLRGACDRGRKPCAPAPLGNVCNRLPLSGQREPSGLPLCPSCRAANRGSIRRCAGTACYQRSRLVTAFPGQPGLCSQAPPFRTG